MHDPQFIGKVRDVVGLYLAPPEDALVLRVGEKSHIQALDRTPLPVLPTTPARMTHDYVRHGTSLFATLELSSGSVIAQSYPPTLQSGVPAVPQAHRRRSAHGPGLHLVLDNYATHKTPEIHKWLLCHPASPRPAHPG